MAKSRDLEKRALKLLEEEDTRNKEIAEKRARQEEEGRLQGAIKRIKDQDQWQRIARAEKEAEARAAQLSHERYELGEEIETAAANLNRLLSEYESLHGKHLAALREAGRPLDHGFGLQEMMTTRFRQWFGGWNSLTGTPSAFHGAQDLPLHERDSLASPGQKEA
jgi:DNA repair exonuclease SbcCD ATPase subunit